MPLKTQDLTTFENYKKAIKQDATRIDPKGKTKFWVYRDVVLPTTGGSKQKIAAFIALVDDTAIKPLLKGSPLTCRGMCGIREGKIAFHPEQGKVPYDLMKASVPLFLGKPLLLPGAIPPPPPPPPASGPKYAQLNATWKQLSEQATKRIAANPAERPALTKAVAGIPEMLRSGKLAEAQKQIERLAALIKVPAPPPPPPASGPKYALLNTRWKQLSQEANRLMTVNPAKRTALTKAMADIPDMLRSGKLGEAGKRIEQLAAAIKIAAAEAKEAEAQSAEWKKLEAKVKQAIVKHPERKADLVRAGAGIAEMIRVGKLQLAKQLMAKVIALLNEIEKKK